MPEAGRGLSLRLTSHQRAVTAEDGERIEYLFKPSRRCRTRLILSYDARQDRPVLTAPYRFAGQQVSDESVFLRGDEFVLQQREYVRRLRAHTLAVHNAAYGIEGGSGYILYRGRKTAVAVDATAKTSYVDVTGDDAVIRLALPQTCSRKEVDRALLALFKAQAKTVLGDLMEAYRRVQEQYASYGVTIVQEGMMPESLIPMYQTLLAHRLLTLRNTIRLSWRLIFLDDAVASYVIAHELAHLEHFNHSKAFWKEVERLCPDWRVLLARLNAAMVLPDLEGSGSEAQTASA